MVDNKMSGDSRTMTKRYVKILRVNYGGKTFGCRTNFKVMVNIIQHWLRVAQSYAGRQTDGPKNRMQ